MDAVMLTRTLLSRRPYRQCGNIDTQESTNGVIELGDKENKLGVKYLKIPHRLDNLKKMFLNVKFETLILMIILAFLSLSNRKSARSFINFTAS